MADQSANVIESSERWDAHRGSDAQANSTAAGADTRPILITGTHYSATTWVGRVLAASDRVGYIWEPFNARGLQTTRGPLFRYWYTYIADHNAGDFEPALARTLNFKYSLAPQLLSARSIKDVARTARDRLQYSVARRRRARPLMKDPIAFLSAPWLAKTFDMQVVVTIRHPAAFAASMKARDSHHDFSHFADQSELMAGPLAPWADDVNSFAQRPRPLSEQAGLIWTMFAALLDNWRRDNPDWIVVRHEDLLDDPAGQFRSLCDSLSLPFDDAVRAELERSTSGANVTADSNRPQSHFVRNTAALAGRWRKVLTEDEIAALKQQVSPWDQHYYPDVEW